MRMPQPSSGHARMQRLEGPWEGEEIMQASQWDPAGGTAIGKTSYRMALNGFVSLHDYEQLRDGAVSFSGHGVMSYDSKSDIYSLHWFDCMGSPVEVFSGRFEADVLVLGHAGPGMHARMTYDLSQPDRMLTRMEMSMDGESWKLLFNGDYRRTAS